jgi:tripartite-type tricarboxylate transporter receptor subunit TctC
MTTARLTRRGFTALACGVAAGASFAADPYPSRPIRIVVCTAPGGATDVTTRLVAQKMSEKLGQSVIVDNKPRSRHAGGHPARPRATRGRLHAAGPIAQFFDAALHQEQAGL